MHVRLIGDSKLILGVRVYGCMALRWTSDGLATSLPFAQLQLGQAPSHQKKP